MCEYISNIPQRVKQLARESKKRKSMRLYSKYRKVIKYGKF
jgi:hypothetical protein